MISFEKFGFVVDCFLCELFLYKMKFLRFLLKFKCPFNFDYNFGYNINCPGEGLGLWALPVSLLQPRTLSLWRPASSASTSNIRREGI